MVSTVEQIYDSISIQSMINSVVIFVNKLIAILLNKLIVPMLVTLKEQSEPIVEYISNQTTWIVPFAVITWYGPSGLLVFLQCIFTFLLILFKLKKLFFN
jgi:hypothetical protein